MKFGIRMRACRRRWSWLLPSPHSPPASAADKKDKTKPAPTQKVDSGSFGVFIKGQRVATETFKIEQQNGASIIKSQLKETAGPTRPARNRSLI